MTQLPDNILSKMSKEDRKSLGRKGMTQAEAEASFTAKNERELQKQIANYLRMKGLFFIQSAMHKATTNQIGTPDFNFPVNGQWVSWEAKHGTGKLSKGQSDTEVRILANGGQFRVIRSLDEARDHLNELQNSPAIRE